MDQRSAAAADEDEAVVQARAADVVVARADVDAAVALGRAAVPRRASRASRSSKSSAWRRKRPSAKAWPRWSAATAAVAAVAARQRRRRIMLGRTACSCQRACRVCRRVLGRQGCWRVSKMRAAEPWLRLLQMKSGGHLCVFFFFFFVQRKIGGLGGSGWSLGHCFLACYYWHGLMGRCGPTVRLSVRLFIFLSRLCASLSFCSMGGGGLLQSIRYLLEGVDMLGVRLVFLPPNLIMPERMDGTNGCGRRKDGMHGGDIWGLLLHKIIWTRPLLVH